MPEWVSHSLCNYSIQFEAFLWICCCVNDWHDHPVTVTWRHCLPPCDFSPLFQNELKRSLGQKHHPLVLMLDSVLSKAVYKQFNLIFDTICFVSVLFCGLFYHLKFCRRPFTATLVSSEKKPL